MSEWREEECYFVATFKRVNSFPDIQFQIGNYVDEFIRWLYGNFAFIFDGLTRAIIWMFLQLEGIMVWLPWWIIILIIFLLGWRLNNIKAGITFAALTFLVGTFGYWEMMMTTVAIVLVSVIIALVVGIPLGIWMAYHSKVETVMKPILDGMQTMPSFVYLIPAMILFGLGTVPAIFATMIYAAPPVIRLTNLAIQRVSKEMVEAGHSFGASSWQLLSKVQLPQALPTIMTGVNQTTMMALAMVVIASMVGAGGLGMEVLISIQQIDIARGFEAGLSIVILAIIIDRLSQGVVEKYKFPE